MMETISSVVQEFLPVCQAFYEAHQFQILTVLFGVAAAVLVLHITKKTDSCSIYPGRVCFTVISSWRFACDFGKFPLNVTKKCYPQKQGSINTRYTVYKNNKGE